MQVTTSTAIQSNQKLFGALARKLGSDDLNTFNNSAGIFATWLSDERAYYTEARPDILKILKAAQATLHRNVGQALDPTSSFHISSCITHPMVPAYSRLLKTVYPFRDRFVEPELHTEINALLKTITRPEPTNTSSNNLTFHNISSTYELPMPKRPNGTAIVQPPPLQLASASSEFITDSSVLSATPNPDTSAGPQSLDKTAQLQDTAPATQASSSTTAHPPQDGPHAPPISVSSETPPSFSTRKKKKKRVNLAFEALVQADLEELRKREAAVVFVKQEPIELLDISNTNLPSNEDISSTSKSPDVVRNVSDASMKAEVDAQPEPMDLPHIANVQFDETVSSPVPVTPVGLAQQNSHMDNFYAPDVSPIAVTTTSSVLSDRPQSFSPRVKSQNFPLLVMTQSPDRRSVDDASVMLTQNGASSIVDQPMANVPIPVDTVPMTESVQSLENTRVSQEPGSVLRTPMLAADQNNPNAFGPGTVTYAVHNGLVARNRAKIQLAISEEQSNALKLWSTRNAHKQDLSEGFCVSLACYPNLSTKTETMTLDEISGFPSVWPMTGGLAMTVVYKGKEVDLPLSPPFLLAPNGLVDLSGFLHPGENIIKITQLLDMSAYVFILRGHHPTAAQLEQAAQRRQKNQAWDDWLVQMMRPLELAVLSTPGR